MIEKIRLERGIGKVGSVAATAMTRQALAAGRENSQVSVGLLSAARMHGYAVEKIMKIRGEMNVARRVPIICVMYWVLGVCRAGS
jgi:hypothetical protein